MRINHVALRVIRELTGKSVADLARDAEIDRSNLTHIEAGRRRGTPRQARSIADALGVPIQAIAVMEPADTEAVA